MKTLLATSLMALAAAGSLAAVAPAAEWTSSKEVAEAARGFAEATKLLHKSIHAVDEDSPLVKEVGDLEKSARHFHKAVADGAAYEHAIKDFEKIAQDYDHFEKALKEDHDVHHDEHVVADAKKAKSAFDHLQARMEGRPGPPPSKPGR